MRGPRPPPAIPAAIGHLFLEEIIAYDIDAVVVIFEGRKDRQHHAGDAGFAYVPPTIIDPAVALQPFVKQERARFSRLAVRSRKAQVTKQQHRVRRGSPLRMVQSASGSCFASSRAPHPSRATRCFSRSTVRSAAPERSRSVCQRMAGSPASSQGITVSVLRGILERFHLASEGIPYSNAVLQIVLRHRQPRLTILSSLIASA
jgi:hypothetical protein